MALIVHPDSFLTSLGPDDRHQHFVYYVSLHGFEHAWIDAWFEDKFGEIAHRFGPKAVFVTASGPLSDFALDDLIESYGRSLTTRELRRAPHLLITRRPIDLQAHHVAPAEFAAIDLSAMQSENDLGRLVDLLLRAGLNGEKNMIGKIAEIKRSFAKNGELLNAVNESLQLKPNIMGLGLNVNGAISYVARQLEQRRARRSAAPGPPSPRRHVRFRHLLERQLGWERGRPPSWIVTSDGPWSVVVFHAGKASSEREWAWCRWLVDRGWAIPDEAESEMRVWLALPARCASGFRDAARSIGCRNVDLVSWTSWCAAGSGERPSLAFLQHRYGQPT